MHADPPLPRAGPGLVRHGVGRHGRKGVIPVPADGVLARLDAAARTYGPAGQRGLLVFRQRVVGRQPASADEKDVAWAEVYPLSDCYGLKLGQGDFMGGEVIDVDLLLGCPGVPVEEDTASSDGLLRNV